MKHKAVLGVFALKREKHTSEYGLYPGTIVILDLDRFKEFTQTRGLSEYEPNFVTGELTKLVEWFAQKQGGVVVYGLDYERGTEEAIIEIPFARPEDVWEDLKKIHKRIMEAGASITIVAYEGLVSCKKARNQREAYHATPWRRSALKKLKEAKRRGGGLLVVV